MVCKYGMLKRKFFTDFAWLYFTFRLFASQFHLKIVTFHSCPFVQPYPINVSLLFPIRILYLEKNIILAFWDHLDKFVEFQSPTIWMPILLSETISNIGAWITHTPPLTSIVVTSLEIGTGHNDCITILGMCYIEAMEIKCHSMNNIPYCYIQCK